MISLQISEIASHFSLLVHFEISLGLAITCKKLFE